jgi:hypothetical protein|nr:MAG TPA: hypothetical protein [Caudoviricetes sp.]
MKKFMRNPYQKIKTADCYTKEELERLIKDAERKHPYLYDYLIDRLYFYTSSKRNTKNAREYSFLTARQEKEKQYHEKSIDNFFNMI